MLYLSDTKMYGYIKCASPAVPLLTILSTMPQVFAPLSNETILSPHKKLWGKLKTALVFYIVIHEINVWWVHLDTWGAGPGSDSVLILSSRALRLLEKSVFKSADLWKRCQKTLKLLFFAVIMMHRSNSIKRSKSDNLMNDDALTVLIFLF